MLKYRFLARLDVEIDAPLKLGATPEGVRQIFHATGGSMSEGRLNTAVLPGGGGWLRLRPSGSTVLDGRGVVRTEEGALIYLRFEGRPLITPEQVARIANPMSATPVAPQDYYFRITPSFETADPRYDWLNNIVAVGTGEMRHGRVGYDIFEVRWSDLFQRCRTVKAPGTIPRLTTHDIVDSARTVLANLDPLSNPSRIEQIPSLTRLTSQADHASTNSL